MRVYKYKSATVYINEPSERTLKIIQNATKVFLNKVVKEREVRAKGSTRIKLQEQILDREVQVL